MDRVSSIFERFDPEHRRLTSDIIGHVRQRAPLSSGDVFKESRAPVKTQQTSMASHRGQFPLLTEARSTTLRKPKTSALQSPFDQLVEASRLQKPIENKPSVDDAQCVQQDACPSFMWSTPYQAPTHPLPTAQTVVPTASAAVSGGTSTDPSKPKPKRKRIRIKTERRRQQCRTNQARYRQKQTERAKTLEMSVKQLKQEIPLLETQRSRLLSIAKPSAVDIADEYFRLFSHGVRDSQHSTGMSSGPQQWLQDSETQHQLDFLRSSMAADVALGDLRGVEELVDQWRRYSTFFKELYFERESMIETSAQSVLAVATLTVTVSEATFQDVFPHLSDEGQDGRAAALRSRLLGQRLFLPCSVSFEMDETCHSVERIDMSVDFLMPLAHGLGSMEDASFVLAEAYITPDGIIGNSKE